MLKYFKHFFNSFGSFGDPSDIISMQKMDSEAQI